MEKQKYNSHIHHRRSIRLKDYDYSLEGLYFITICTRDQLNLFGEIVGAGSKPAPGNHISISIESNQNNELNKMILNEYGQIVENT